MTQHTHSPGTNADHVDTELRPTSKMTAAGAAGAGSLLIVWAAGLFGLEMPPEVAAAITTILAFGAGYLKPERHPVAPRW